MYSADTLCLVSSQGSRVSSTSVVCPYLCECLHSLLSFQSLICFHLVQSACGTPQWRVWYAGMGGEHCRTEKNTAQNIPVSQCAPIRREAHSWYISESIFDIHREKGIYTTGRELKSIMLYPGRDPVYVVGLTLICLDDFVLIAWFM